MKDDFSFKIVQTFGVISTSKSGWSLELNSVDWNNRGAKYDLRSWSPDHQNMGRGVTLTKKEILKLRELLSEMEL